MHQRILLTKFGQNWTFGYGARGRMPEEERTREQLSSEMTDLSRKKHLTYDIRFYKMTSNYLLLTFDPDTVIDFFLCFTDAHIMQQTGTKSDLV